MTTTARRRIDKLAAAIGALSTDMILESVTRIGGGDVTQDQRMVRAYLIEEYIRREGAEAGDLLMDLIGL